MTCPVRLLTLFESGCFTCHCSDVTDQFEQVIESRYATREPAGQPGNDTGVIRHGLFCRVKHCAAIPYHLVTKFRRFCCDGPTACRVQALTTTCWDSRNAPATRAARYCRAM